MKVEESKPLNAGELTDLCRRATQILVTNETKQRFPNGHDAINAKPIEPTLPVNRAAATPHIMLVGPFRDEPDLSAVAIWIGIGVIQVRDVTDVAGAECSYDFLVIDGEGYDARGAYLQTAFQLYFCDVRVVGGKA
jgi:hypothetical protein